MSDSEEMIDLLRYASDRKVAVALGVKRQSVWAWARGKHVTPYRVRQVRDLLRPTQREAAPPQWVERVLASLMLQESREGVTEAELVEAQIRAAAYLVVARRAPRAQDDGGAGGAVDE